MNFTCALLSLLSFTVGASAIDLTRSLVVVPSNASKLENKAAAMLVDEVAKRSQIQWEISTAPPYDDTPVILLGTDSAHGPVDGFAIGVHGKTVSALGNDPRGTLFSVGYLLRHFRMTKGSVSLADDFSMVTAPKYSLRGHQLGYRPKTHSYDAWDLKIWEQYYRDLIVFGANAIELIPPRSDDDDDSPHFPLPPLPMMAGMSKLADDYGLDVWIWYPAMDKDYSDPKTVEFALKEWIEVFQRLPRTDAVFVPGGDPGHT